MRALRREIAADIVGGRTCKRERFIGMRAGERGGLAGANSVYKVPTYGNSVGGFAADFSVLGSNVRSFATCWLCGKGEAC